MMLLLLSTAAILVTSSLALPTDPMMTSDMMMSSPTKPCCPPARWQGELIDLKQVATGGVLQIGTLFAMDATMQLEATLSADRQTGAVKLRTFSDYNNMQSYQVDEAGKCTKSALTTPQYKLCDRSTNSTDFKMPPGMSSYSYFGNGTTGGVGLGSEFDAWSFSYSSGINVTMTFNKKGCIPVLEVVANSKETRDKDYIWLLQNISTDVDPSYLSLPPQCAGMDVVG